MILQLPRFGSLPGVGTFGELHVGQQIFYTVEKEWADNVRYLSCIPAGFYDLVPHSSVKYPDVWALVGKGVSHYEEPGVARFACLIHIGNWPESVSGCISPGKELTEISGKYGRKLGVTSSTTTIDRLRKYLNTGEKHQINITWANLGEAA